MKEASEDQVRLNMAMYMHIYLSPSCYHENHRQCRFICHLCESTCICNCHVRKVANGD